MTFKDRLMLGAMAAGVLALPAGFIVNVGTGIILFIAAFMVGACVTISYTFSGANVGRHIRPHGDDFDFQTPSVPRERAELGRVISAEEMEMRAERRRLEKAARRAAAERIALEEVEWEMARQRASMPNMAFLMPHLMANMTGWQGNAAGHRPLHPVWFQSNDYHPW